MDKADKIVASIGAVVAFTVIVILCFVVYSLGGYKANSDAYKSIELTGKAVIQISDYQYIAIKAEVIR